MDESFPLFAIIVERKRRDTKRNCKKRIFRDQDIITCIMIIAHGCERKLIADDRVIYKDVDENQIGSLISETMKKYLVISTRLLLPSRRIGMFVVHQSLIWSSEEGIMSVLPNHTSGHGDMSFEAPPLRQIGAA
jgi:hypothetical protein